MNYLSYIFQYDAIHRYLINICAHSLCNSQKASRENFRKQIAKKDEVKICIYTVKSLCPLSQQLNNSQVWNTGAQGGLSPQAFAWYSFVSQEGVYAE